VDVIGETKMELGTFGAVMGYAVQLNQQSAGFYDTALHAAQNPELAALLQSLADDAAKDLAALEQARRENVTEMILEPIAGLRREEYEVDVTRPASDAEIIRSAKRLEERDQKFFRDASTKVPLPEVARLFRRMAAKKEKNLGKLGERR
jgi:rubrerythrin